MDSTKSDETSTDDAKIKSDLFNLVENLRIEMRVKDQELQRKDEELANERQEKQKLSTDLALEKTRANRAVTELASAQELIDAHQMCLWKSFPRPDLYYYIKTKSGSQNGQFLYLCDGNKYVAYLRPSADDRLGGIFKFTRNSDGSFSVHTMEQERSLKTNVFYSPKVEFTRKRGSAEKFVLIFHQQNQQAGLLVDICSLDGYFLCVDNDNFVVANSRTPPAEKLLIIPAEADYE